MKYVAHRRYRGLSAFGKRLNLPYGTELETQNKFILSPEGEAICFDTSEVAKMYFARNDDGNGLERGKLTYAIAYGKRATKDGYRFTDSERKMLTIKYSRFLRTDVDMLLFNDSFFAADVGELRELADALKIKVRR